MKYVIGTLLSLFFISSAQADNAVGFVLGDPTGLSGRMSLDRAHSLEGAFAYNSGYYEGLHLHFTYQWDRARQINTAADPLYLYYGLGARLITINKGRHEGNTAFGPRAPLGVTYILNNPNLEIFGELAAIMDLSPRFDLDIDAGIGVRVRF